VSHIHDPCAFDSRLAPRTLGAYAPQCASRFLKLSVELLGKERTKLFFFYNMSVLNYYFHLLLEHFYPLAIPLDTNVSITQILDSLMKIERITCQN